MRPISKIIRQFAAVALLALALASVASLIIAPFASRLNKLGEQIIDERSVLGRFEAVAAQQGDVLELQRAARAANESNAYLKGESEASRAANLQTLLAETAARQGVRLSSTRALPQRNDNDLLLVGVRVQFNADIEQLRALLFEVESARPFLFVKGVQVRPVSALAQRDPEFGGLLDVRFDVFSATPRRKR